MAYIVGVSVVWLRAMPNKVASLTKSRTSSQGHKPMSRPPQGRRCDEVLARHAIAGCGNKKNKLKSQCKHYAVGRLVQLALCKRPEPGARGTFGSFLPSRQIQPPSSLTTPIISHPDFRGTKSTKPGDNATLNWVKMEQEKVVNYISGRGGIAELLLLALVDPGKITSIVDCFFTARAGITAKKALASPVFADLDLVTNTPKKWFEIRLCKDSWMDIEYNTLPQIIVRTYTNYLHQVYRKDHPQNPTASAPIKADPLLKFSSVL
ncbi:hypothetical protein B0H11DRAFT_1902449 [Mycena galericulata]|nr:hypothetical protein B0H11DRAFT_1902449 [Mycena galericulata]